jgi:nickel/cobalt exporter
MEGLTLTVLLGAAGVAFVHTALGPDHYLPFVAMGRARSWSMRRTLALTALCGAGHVLSSLVLGAIALWAGAALVAVQVMEAVRGDWAAWVLFGAGVAYALWGIRHALRRRSGLGPHRHGAGDAPTSWALFLIFVLGPCEPLIPLLALPASQGHWAATWMAAAVFCVVTLVTMVGATAALLAGLPHAGHGALGRWSHALAGGIVAASAGSVLFLGL